MLLPCARIDSRGRLTVGQTVPRAGCVVRNCCQPGCFQILEVAFLRRQMVIAEIGEDGNPKNDRRAVPISPEWTIVQLNGACPHGTRGCATPP